MSRTTRFAYPMDAHQSEIRGERAAKKNRKEREYRKGEPKIPALSIGRLRREIKASELWEIVR